MVVDDQPENIKLLKESLFPEFKLKVVTQGVLALKLAMAEVSPPDLILLDVMMPEMDGFEVCRRLKSCAATQEIPIIFLTAKARIEDEARGLALGAVDYITKPISPPIVLARIRTHLALRSAHRILAEKNELLLFERAIMEQIVLQMRHESQFYTQGLRYLVSPVEKTNGDLLLSKRTSSGKHRVLLGDFTGHGLPAAVGAPLVSHIFHAENYIDSSVETILALINQELLQRLPVNLFMVAVFMELDRENMTLDIRCCGVPNVLIFRRNFDRLRVTSSYPALGVMADLSGYSPSPPLSLQSGDRVFAYSDGLIEQRSASGALFGEDRLEKELARILQQDAPIDEVLRTLEHFSRGREVADDVTLVEMQV